MNKGFSEAFQGKDSKSLALLLRSMQKLERKFCDSMMAGTDFTLRIELKGNGGVLSHARVYGDEIDRPIISKKDV